MASIKEKIYKEVEASNDEKFLEKIYKLMHEVNDMQQVLKLNPEQIAGIEEGERDYLAGDHCSTEELMKRLLNGKKS